MSNSINLKEFIERISYNKSQTYTKEEVLQELAKIQLLSIVDTLPTENIPSNKIFLVLNDEEIEGNKYDLFVYVNNKWEQIDSLEFNIEDYPTKNELDYELSLKADINHGHDNVTTSSDGFMSKEDKSKLNGIENQATRNLPSDDNPLMDGTASSGTGKDYSRKDHVHPTDTSRASSTHVHGNISNDGKIGSTANKPLITTTSGSVTTGNFETSTNNIKMDGTVNVGSSNNFARSDHVHPTDTSRASTDTATSSKNGLMSKEDKSKLDGVEDEANNYTHPSYTAKTNGLYKVTVDNTGHISGTNTVSGSDLPSHNHDTGDMKDTSAYGNIGSSANATQKTINNNINTKLGQKANSSDVYTKSQTMTSTEIGQAIADGVSNVEIFEVVTTLPTSNIKGNKFYLVPNGENIDGNVYDVNIYVNNKWETIDKLEFDISNYPTTTQVNSLLEGKVDKTDSRLTDSRTPKSHTHGNITNTGAIGSTSGKIVTTGTNGVLTTSDTITKSQISDFPSTMTPSSHTHGAVQNNGTLNSDTTSTNKVVVTDSSNNIKTISKLPLDKVTHQDISGKASSTHTHGSIANNGTLNSDTTTVGKVVVTDGSNNIKTISKLPSANVTHQDISGKAPNNHKSTATTYGVGDASNYGHVKVDSSMNATSTNPVQNKVVKDYIDEQVGDIISGDVDLSNTHNHDDRYIKTGTGTVTSTNIADKTIVNGDIADATIETGKIKNGAITNEKLSGTKITASSSSIVDLNDATYQKTGFYYCDNDNYAPYIIHCPWSNGTATPYTGNKSFFLFVEDWGTNTYSCKQTLTYYNGNNTYTRTKTNSTTWTAWKEHNTNNNDYLRLATRVISGEAIVANNIIGGSNDSKYYKLKSGLVLDTRYPILFNTSAITSGSYTDNVYSSHTGVPLTNNVSGKTVTSQKQVYIEGTSYDGKLFTVSDRVFVSDDQINSTTDLGKYYIYIGVSYSTTNIRFNSFHQTVYVETRNGLVPVGDNTNNPHMLIKGDAGTAGYFKFLTIRTVGTYHDQTIEFDTTHRGNKPKTVVSFNFNTYEKTSGSKQYYTNIQAFYYHGHPTPVYYIQTNDGVQDATFDFYIRRETWDEIGVSDLRSSIDNYNGMTVTWHNDFVTALPTGTTQATLNPYYAQVGHTHGSITNNGQLNSDITSVNKVAVTDSSNNLKTINQLPYSKISGTPTSMTPTAHTDSNGAYGKATTSVWGHTKLSSATNSTDETMSATPKAVKTAYDLANGKSTVSVKQTKTSGIEIGSVTVNGTETKLYQQDNNTTYSNATTSANGLMSSTDKINLDKTVNRYNGNFISGVPTVNKPYLRLFNLKAKNSDSSSSHIIFEIIGNNNDRLYAKIRVDMRQNTSTTNSSYSVTPLEVYGFNLNELYFGFRNAYPNTSLDIFRKVGAYTNFYIRYADDHTRDGTVTMYSPVVNGTESYVDLSNASTSLYNASYTATSQGGTYEEVTNTIPYTNVNANKFVKRGGTSSQFLKADGSVDGNAYSTTSHTHNYLPTNANGTTTGTLTATKFINSSSNNTNILLGNGNTLAQSTFATSGHTHSYLPLSGGDITGRVSLPIARDSTSNTDNSNIPWAGTNNLSWDTDMWTTLKNRKSLMGTFSDGSKWWNVISNRHRNGNGDGTSYGMYLRTTLQDDGHLLWAKQKGASSFMAERTILDSSNYSTYANKTTIVDNLTSGGTGSALSAEQGKNLQNNKVDKAQGSGNANKTLSTDASGNVIVEAKNNHTHSYISTTNGSVGTNNLANYAVDFTKTQEFSADGGASTAGYVKVMQITIGGAWKDMPIIFEVFSRSKGVSYVTLMFKNDSGNDPLVNVFTYTGVENEIYIVKNTTSKWDIVVKKPANDKIVIKNLQQPHSYVSGGVTFAQLNTLLSSTPTLGTNDKQATFVGFTSAEKTKLSGIATGANKTTIANNLTTTTTGSALDATQGKWLYDNLVSSTSTVKNGHTHNYLTSVATANINANAVTLAKLNSDVYDTTNGGTSGSSKLITSGAVFNGLSGKANSSHNQASSTITDSTTYGNIGNSAQNQGSINSAINTKLGNAVYKSSTSGLLKNDGGVMTSGTGALNFATGNHTHTFTEITKSGEQYCRVWVDTSLRRVRVTASRSITVSSGNANTFINFSSLVLVDDAYLPIAPVYAQTNWNGVIVGVSLDDGVKGRLRVRADHAITTASLTEAYLEWTY